MYVQSQNHSSTWWANQQKSLYFRAFHINQKREVHRQHRDVRKNKAKLVGGNEQPKMTNTSSHRRGVKNDEARLMGGNGQLGMTSDARSHKTSVSGSFSKLRAFIAARVFSRRGDLTSNANAGVSKSGREPHISPPPTAISSNATVTGNSACRCKKGAARLKQAKKRGVLKKRDTSTPTPTSRSTAFGTNQTSMQLEAAILEENKRLKALLNSQRHS
jgi:hypothetical protein